MSTYTDLIALAEQIRTAQAESSNTAELVGSTVKAVVEYIRQAVAEADYDNIVTTIRQRLLEALDDISSSSSEADASIANALNEALEEIEEAKAGIDLHYQAISGNNVQLKDGSGNLLMPKTQASLTDYANAESKLGATNIQSAIDELSGEYFVDVVNLAANSKYINASNSWQSGGSSGQVQQFCSTNYAVSAGEVYLLDGIVNGVIYAFLRSNTTLGNPVDFSASHQGRIQIQKGERVIVTIPSDTTLLYFYRGKRNTLTNEYVDDWRPKITRLTDNGIRKLETPQSVYKKGMMMGDSITYGVYSYFNNGQRWNGVELNNGIAKYVGICTGTICDNIGKRGTGYVIDTRDVDNAWELAQKTNYANYDYVVMMYGVNDYIMGAPLGTLEENAEGTIVGNMTRTFNKIQTDNPNCKILCVGSYNCWGQVSQGGDYTGNDYYGDETTDYALGYVKNGHTLREVLNIQKAVCEKYHIKFLCLADDGVINFYNIKNTLIDGLHPSLEIRKAIAQAIACNLK